MKRKELLWMLLPCLLLGGAALYFIRREAALAQPWSLKIARIERAPLLPREVAAGYDTKLKITFAETGTRPLDGKKPLRLSLVPQGVKIVRRRDEKTIAVPLKMEPKYHMGSETTPPPFTVLTALAGVPVGDGELALWGRTEAQRLVWLKAYPFAKSSIVATLPFDHTVRAKGEIVRLPEASQDCPLTLKEMNANPGEIYREVINGKISGAWRVSVTVKFSRAPFTRYKHPDFTTGNAYLIDEKGRRTPLIKDSGFRNMGGYGYVNDNGRARDDVYSLDYQVADALLPPKGVVKLSVQISANDAWPVEAVGVLRDDKKLPPSPLVVRSLRIMCDKRSPSIIVRIDGETTRRLSKLWEEPKSDWAQQIQIGKGARQSLVYGRNNWERPKVLFSSAGRPQWRVTYVFSAMPGMNTIPPGSGIFKTKLRVPGYDWLPLEAPVPDAVMNSWRVSQQRVFNAQRGKAVAGKK